jgi:hypothetical protein
MGFVSAGALTLNIALDVGSMLLMGVINGCRKTG